MNRVPKAKHVPKDNRRTKVSPYATAALRLLLLYVVIPVRPHDARAYCSLRDPKFYQIRITGMLLYALPNLHVEYVRVEPPGIPTAFWRRLSR
jgi:hypothetical protein